MVDQSDLDRLKALFDGATDEKVADVEQRYRRILTEFDVDPRLIASLVAIIHGTVALRRKSIETTAYDVSRVLLALLVWMEFGADYTARLAEFLLSVIKNPTHDPFNGNVPNIIHANVEGRSLVSELDTKFEFRHNDGSINDQELGRFLHTFSVDIPAGVDIPMRDMILRLTAMIRHIATHHMEDRDEALRTLASASNSLAEVADAFAEATSCKPETGKPPLAN